MEQTIKSLERLDTLIEGTTPIDDYEIWRRDKDILRRASDIPSINWNSRLISSEDAHRILLKKQDELINPTI